MKKFPVFATPVLLRTEEGRCVTMARILCVTMVLK